MSTLPATLKLDVRLQARSKLYAIGIAVALLFGFAGRYFVNPNYAGNVLAVFYLIGIGGTTYFFAASLVLLEKSEGTLQALRTTPLTSTAYITSKVITLTSFALIESAIVYFVAFFGVPLNPAPLIFGVVSLGVTYTLVSLGQVASHDSVTAFRSAASSDNARNFRLGCTRSSLGPTRRNATSRVPPSCFRSSPTGFDPRPVARLYT